MTSRVYFTDLRTARGSNLVDKVERLFLRAELHRLYDAKELVALKVHFGEPGNLAFLRPQYARRLVDRIKKAGARPFLTDANTLYLGRRANAVDHLQAAIENGWDYAVVGAPLVIADGLTGQDYVEVPINRKRFQTVKISSAAYHADALIALTHFKGHEATGYGGALKNIGMGLGSRGGKQQMHSDLLPAINTDLCDGCARCRRWCPGGAITVTDKSSINHEKCIGCGECTITCPNNAIRIEWKTEPDVIQEKIAEYALGVVQDKPGKVGFINFVTAVSPDCDCAAWNDSPIVADIGVLASTDPVAIDQASYDLVKAARGLPGTRLGEKLAPGRDKFQDVHGVDGTLQLIHGEAIGLGSRQYELIKVG